MQLVSSMNSSTESCSGLCVISGRARKSATPSGWLPPARSALRAAKSGLSEPRIILRRWLKLVFTTRRSRRSSQPQSVRPLRVRRTTALFTFGGGLNTPGSTVKRYSTSYHSCISTLNMPYTLLPGAAARRSATSFCIMPVHTGIRWRYSSILKKIWLLML